MRLRECLRTFETMQCLSAATCVRPSTKAAQIAHRSTRVRLNRLQRHSVVEIAANEVKDGRPSAR
jgi:hypothetical protein